MNLLPSHVLFGRFRIILLLFGLATTDLQAQHTLRIQVNDFRKSGPFFLSGTINGWTPNDTNYQLKRINYFRSEITLYNLRSGEQDFKITRGSFETVETTAEGEDIRPRVINLQGDTTVLFIVRGWKDDNS